MRYLCVKLVKNTNMLVEQCALMCIFVRNDQVVRLLEHVRKLESIRFVFRVGLAF